MFAPMPLRVVDLFCGAGGLTEGFRQMGFDVEAALDNWKPAVETHRINHPSTVVHHADILEFEPADLDRPDVLIGSPPCTEFSYANRGGGGDIAQGMRFVLRFLRFVYELQPKYWVMENVPRLFQTLPASVPLAGLGIDKPGELSIPVRVCLNSADYGVPQKRVRLFSGSFPVPAPLHSSGARGAGTGASLPRWRNASEVLERLPNPLSKPKQDGIISDPNYDLQILTRELTDHFGDTSLTPEEVALARRVKVDHSWYGKMRFPDPVDRPARTIMATQFNVSRETIILNDSLSVDGKYRRPTIRECACFQSFPINYQFWGGTPQIRYKLVGNSVPPLLAAAIAREIAVRAGVPVPERPTPPVDRTRLVESIAYTRHRPTVVVMHLPAHRRFRNHLPGSREGSFRVDLENSTTERQLHPLARTFENGPPRPVRHTVSWVARLYAGTGRGFTSVAPSLESTAEQLASAVSDSESAKSVLRFVRELDRWVPRLVPDATTLQAGWSGRHPKAPMTPPMLLDLLSASVEKHFPAPRFSERSVRTINGLRHIARHELPVRTIAFLLAARYAAAVLNEGDRWLRQHRAKAYVLEDWWMPPQRARTRVSPTEAVGTLQGLMLTLLQREAPQRRRSLAAPERLAARPMLRR